MTDRRCYSQTERTGAIRAMLTGGRSNRTAGDSPSTLPSSKRRRETGWEARGSAQAVSRFRRMSQALKRLPGASSKRTGRETLAGRLAEALRRLPGVRRSHPRSAGGRHWPEARGSDQAASRFRRMSQALKRLPGVRRGHPRSGSAGDWPKARGSAQGSRERSSGFQAFDVAILEADRQETGRRLAEALKRLPGVRRSHPRSALAGDTGRRLAEALRRVPGVRRGHPRSRSAGDWPKARGSAQAASRRSTWPSSKRTGGRLAEGSRKRSGGFQAFDVAILEASAGDWPGGSRKRSSGFQIPAHVTSTQAASRRST